VRLSIGISGGAEAVIGFIGSDISAHSWTAVGDSVSEARTLAGLMPPKIRVASSALKHIWDLDRWLPRAELDSASGSTTGSRSQSSGISRAPFSGYHGSRGSAPNSLSQSESSTIERERLQLRSAGKSLMQLLQQTPMPSGQVEGEQTISSDWYVSLPTEVDSSVISTSVTKKSMRHMDLSKPASRNGSPTGAASKASPLAQSKDAAPGHAAHLSASHASVADSDASSAQQSRNHSESRHGSMSASKFFANQVSLSGTMASDANSSLRSAIRYSIDMQNDAG